MSQDSVRYKVNYVRYLAFSLVLALPAPSVAAPLNPIYDGPVTIEPLDPGTTDQMEADFTNKETHPENQPDRSFLNVWIRMFPLLSVPLGDPYPVTQDVNHLSISNADGIKIYALADGTLLTSGTAVDFDFEAGQVKVNGRAFVLDAIWLWPQGSTTTTIQWDKGQTLNGKSTEVRVRLRGGFVIQRTWHSKRDGSPLVELWSMLNVATVNSYLKSVVPSEVIASWKSETLKAQAIAARTYGMYEVASSRGAHQAYDLDPTTWYQSYQGAQFWNRETQTWRDVELNATTAAVTATGAQVLTHSGEIIKAFFSSNSGGRTCTFKECLDGGSNVPYLREVDDAPGTRNSPGGTWGTRSLITPASVTERLKLVNIIPTSPVKKLEHLERGVSGRTWRLRVRLKDGSAIDLDRAQTKKVMFTFGPVRSFDYELGSVASSGQQSIVGHGYGHGVGMSQWGAQLFARSGWNASRILKHYYTGVVIKDLSAGP